MKPDPKPPHKKKKRRKLPKKIVREVFLRDSHTCQYCGRTFPPNGHDLDCSLQVHHIFHVSQGGKDVLENLNSCCAECHHDHGEISRIDLERIKTNVKSIGILA